MTTKKPASAESDTVVISFRAPRDLVAQLDEIASGDQRTRANFIVSTLTKAISLEPAITTIGEHILPRLVELDKKKPDSMQAEYSRGLMCGASWMLSALYGKRAVSWVKQQVRRRTNLPIPLSLPLNEDGNRYGSDLDADI